MIICPLRHWDFDKWVCSINPKADINLKAECPKTLLDDFIFNDCTIWKDEIQKAKEILENDRNNSIAHHCFKKYWKCNDYRCKNFVKCEELEKSGVKNNG